jgi:hypothetical protein
MVSKSKGVKTGCNLAESSKEGCSLERAVSFIDDVQRAVQINL